MLKLPVAVVKAFALAPRNSPLRPANSLLGQPWTAPPTADKLPSRLSDRQPGQGARSIARSEAPMTLAKSIDLQTLSLLDALDLAIAIEQEARERYKEFAELIGDRYHGDAAEFFESMVINEEKHRAALVHRRQALFGNAPARVETDDVADIEAPEHRVARNYMGTRQALEVALAAEHKAWEFFNDALPQLRDEDVRALFTELRDEEAHHSQMVRDLLDRVPGDDDADREADEVDTPNL